VSIFLYIIHLILGPLQKLISWRSFWLTCSVFFILLSLLVVINVGRNESMSESDVKIVFTSSDCVEVAYGWRVHIGARFLLRFNGWNVQNCDDSSTNEERTGYCDTFDSEQLSRNRYPQNNQAFSLDSCVNSGPNAISASSVSNNASDALKIYLLKDSNITIELCAPDRGSQNYSIEIFLINNWVALRKFLANSSKIEDKFVVKRLYLSYGNGQGCKNHSLGVFDESTYVYFAMQVHSSYAEFKLLRGIVNKYYYNVNGLDIVREKNRVKDAEENQWSFFSAVSNYETLVCVAPGTKFFKMCLANFFTYKCPAFIVVATTALLLLLLLLPCFWKFLKYMYVCCCSNSRHRSGYASLDGQSQSI